MRLYNNLFKLLGIKYETRNHKFKNARAPKG